MNTTSIALGAVHNRLRILGQSDADISRIEATQDVLGLSANTVVAAPIGGTVVQRQAGLGQNIVSASAGASNPVFLIGDFSKVWLVANVREEDAPKLHVGDAVEVSVLAFPDRVFRARLTYVAAAIDPATHRLPVRAEVENTSGALKPDMFANFRIITGQDVRSPAIPAVAVVYEADSAHVWVANPSDKSLEIRQITPGRSRDGMVEVVDGLKSGEQVVTAGAVFIDRAATGD
jgi:cobalt-zinc-cadmium efflux system membrane fusion protein